MVLIDRVSHTTNYHSLIDSAENVLKEKSSPRKDIIVCYLIDLMVDATDFTWQGAKAKGKVGRYRLNR